MSSELLNLSLKEKDLNFVKLTQTVFVDGQPTKVTEKIYPHRKGFLLKRMRMQLKKQSPAFWHDLARKNEAWVEGPFGSSIHFLITPIDGDSLIEKA